MSIKFVGLCKSLKNGHWNVIKCILRYLRATMDYDIHLKKGSKLSLVGFSYAKWGSYPND